MPAKTKPKILILYDYFSPAVRAGGIVQSMIYLVRNFHTHFDFYILCSDQDLGNSKLLDGIVPDSWQSFEGKAQVFYASPSHLSFWRIQKLIRQTDPDCIYVCGIYSLKFNLYPLFIRKFNIKKRLVLAPRGMLQQGALKVKPLKKKIFQNLLRVAGLLNDLHWHATDTQEVEDIRRIKKNASVILAYAAPSLKSLDLQKITKSSENCRFVTISLITDKKNILFFLKLLEKFSYPIMYDIYGPVKDKPYWSECKRVISNLPDHIRVQYCGNLNPEEVSDTLRQYHFFVLPTLGENFGHAIYESLNAGRPVLISPYTPWQAVEKLQAGWQLPLQADAWLTCLEDCYKMEQPTYDQYCEHAQKVAADYVKSHDFLDQYQKLFLSLDT